MTPEERRKLRIKRLIQSRKGRKLALAGVLGMTGAGGVMRTTPQTRSGPVYDDPVKEAVAETMVPRLAGQGWDLPNLDHERVDFWVDRFQNDPGMHERMLGFLQRSGRYLPMIAVKLEERDMPHDLIFLAMIESGFDPTAFSSASASGLWQFIPETGRRYGLTVNRTVDERNHPEKATDAALTYLGELHERFNSWYLAAAAYNTGENRVARIMREETGSERATSEEDYYRIWDRLPRETRDYVPLMIAAGRIAKAPGTYGFEHVIPDEAVRTAEVPVRGGTTLVEVAGAVDVPLGELRALNPHLLRERTPRDDDYPVRLPDVAVDRLASDASILPGGTRTAERVGALARDTGRVVAP